MIAELFHDSSCRRADVEMSSLLAPAVSGQFPASFGDRSRQVRVLAHRRPLFREITRLNRCPDCVLTQAMSKCVDSERVIDSVAVAVVCRISTEIVNALETGGYVTLRVTMSHGFHLSPIEFKPNPLNERSRCGINKVTIMFHYANKRV